MSDPYVVEACYSKYAGIGNIDADGWMVVASGGREYCRGYLDARRETLDQRPEQRLRHIPSGRILDRLAASDHPAFGMVAGWPTVDQRIRAALSALRGLTVAAGWRDHDRPPPELMADVEAATALLERHRAGPS